MTEEIKQVKISIMRLSILHNYFHFTVKIISNNLHVCMDKKSVTPQQRQTQPLAEDSDTHAIHQFKNST